MINLFRMWRFCVLVDKQVKLENTDDGLRGFKEAADYELLYVLKERPIENYQPYFAKDKTYAADRIIKLCQMYGYIDIKGSSIAITYHPGGGADLIEAYGLGYIRELAKANNNFFTLVVAVAALIISILN